MIDKKKTDLSQYCKENCGLDAKQVAAYAKMPRRTFYAWWGSRREIVKLIVLCVKRELDNLDNKEGS